MMQRCVSIGFLLLTSFSLVACKEEALPVVSVPTANAPEVSEAPTTIPDVTTSTETTDPATPTDIPPSPTATEPFAALVNDEPIFLSTYEKELARYEQAQAELGPSVGNPEGSNYQTLVLDVLVERVLITQAAETQGIVITPQMLDVKLAELQSAAGETGNFQAWLEANQWTEDEFREALAIEMLTEQVVSTVTAEVPSAVEQVHARYLQVDDLALAQSLVERIQNGDDFTFLAQQHSLDRITAQNGGDLGFFARGSLLVPAVEVAAFALEIGEVSEIITDVRNDGNGDQTTYYLVQLMERDPQRPLTADLRYTLLQQAFETWLDAQWEQATIVRFIDTET